MQSGYKMVKFVVIALLVALASAQLAPEKTAANKISKSLQDNAYTHKEQAVVGGVKPLKADRDAIMQGVKSVMCEGTISFLSAFSNSTTLLTGVRVHPIQLPIGVAGRYGNARMVGLAHNSFLYPEESPTVTSDNNAFILNVFRWAGGASLKKVAVVYSGSGSYPPLVQLLETTGASVTAIYVEDLPKTSTLSDYDAVSIITLIEKDSLPVLQNYVKSGGGLIFAVNSYNHASYVNGSFITNYAPNIISKDFGFVWWGYGTAYEGLFNASIPNEVVTNFDEAVSKLRATVEGTRPIGPDVLQLRAILNNGMENIPKDYLKSPKVYKNFLRIANPGRQPTPHLDNPISDPLLKLKLQIFHDTIPALQLKDVTIHPSSPFFPGNVSSAPTASSYQEHNVDIVFNKLRGPAAGGERRGPRLDSSWIYAFDDERPNSVKSKWSRLKRNAQGNVIDTHPTWYSTGLYAPAGSVIEARVTTGQTNTSFLTLQIGSHSDDNTEHAKWYRPPLIVLRTQFVDGKASLASPYGGTIFIESSQGLQLENQPVGFAFTGTVKTPYFKLGKTTNQEWKDVIRKQPGPWTELATDKIIFSVLTETVQELDDPTSLLTLWDQIMDAMSDFNSIPRTRMYPERVVSDAQISTGFMHSGYPIMCNVGDSVFRFLNETYIRTIGNWGIPHELGHNLQESAWTFEGTIQVTNNIMVLYVYETILKIPIEEIEGELFAPVGYRPRIKNYVSKGLDWEIWKADPWLSLMMYVQLQKAYGWMSYPKIFAQYRTLTADQLPKNNQEKMDLWVIQFSKMVKQNLYNFFRSWGLPMSSGLEEKLAQYPPANLSMLQLL